MQNWKVRGTKDGKFTEVIVQAQDWADAAQAGRAAPHLVDVRDVELVGLPERACTVSTDSCLTACCPPSRARTS